MESTKGKLIAIGNVDNKTTDSEDFRLFLRLLRHDSQS